MRACNQVICKWLLSYRPGKTWIPGTIIEKTGPISYKIDTGGYIVRKHVDQIRIRYCEKPSTVETDAQLKSDDSIATVPATADSKITYQINPDIPVNIQSDSEITGATESTEDKVSSKDIPVSDSATTRKETVGVSKVRRSERVNKGIPAEKLNL